MNHLEIIRQAKNIQTGRYCLILGAEPPSPGLNMVDFYSNMLKKLSEETGITTTTLASLGASYLNASINPDSNSAIGLSRETLEELEKFGFTLP